MAKHRGEHNRLGFAVQMGTVQFLGMFLADPLDVPWSVADYLAIQLDVRDSSVIKRYAGRQATQWSTPPKSGRCSGTGTSPARRQRLGCGSSSTGGRGCTPACVRAVRAGGGVAASARVLLPGVSILSRMVATVREAAAELMHRTLAEAVASADAELPHRLVELLRVRSRSCLHQACLLAAALCRSRLDPLPLGEPAILWEDEERGVLVAKRVAHECPQLLPVVLVSAFFLLLLDLDHEQVMLR